MGVNSLPKTVTRQRRDCDLNPSLLRLSPATAYSNSRPWSSTLTTRLASHPSFTVKRVGGNVEQFCGSQDRLQRTRQHLHQPA